MPSNIRFIKSALRRIINDLKAPTEVRLRAIITYKDIIGDFPARLVHKPADPPPAPIDVVEADLSEMIKELDGQERSAQ